MTSDRGVNAQRQPPPSRHLHSVGVCVALLALIAVVYAQVYGFDFVLYDDDVYLADNPRVNAGLTKAGIRWAFTTLEASNWVPLTWLSHMLDFTAFGDDPGPHHLVNVLLHALNSLLVFLVLRRLTDAFWPSAFVAAVFAVHPVHVESVAWISERKDVLSTLCWLLALAGYGAYTRRPTVAKYIFLVALPFVLGLTAKPMLVTLPATLLLLDYWPLRRLDPTRPPRAAAQLGRLFLEKLPLFLISAGFAVAEVVAAYDPGRVSETFPAAVRVANAIIAYVAYLRFTLWPAGLAVVCPYPGLTVRILPTALCAAVLLVITLAATAYRRRFPFLFVGWLWYLGTLLPVVNIIQMHTQPYNDRYLYVPLLGLLFMAAWGAAAAQRQWRVPRAAVAAVAAAVIVALAVAAHAQARHWRSSITLFEHAVAVTAGNAEAHLGLGNAYAEAERFEDAIEQYRRAYELRPAHAKAVVHDALSNWAAALLELNRGKTGRQADLVYSDVYAKCHAALSLNPALHRAHYTWGRALAAQARTKQGEAADRLFDAACAKFTAALQWEPGFAGALYHWGNARLYQAGRKEGEEARRLYEEACGKYEAALGSRPGFVEAHNGWGSSLLGQARALDGPEREARIREAEQQFLRAEALRPGAGAYNAACARALLGDAEGCRRWLERCRGRGALPPPDHLLADSDLDSVRDSAWFEELVRGLRTRGAPGTRR